MRLPSNLRKFAGGSSAIELGGDTVRELLDDLEAQYPELKSAIVNADGQLQTHLQLFVNGHNTRDLDGEQTHLKCADELLLVAPVAGG